MGETGNQARVAARLRVGRPVDGPVVGKIVDSVCDCEEELFAVVGGVVALMPEGVGGTVSETSPKPTRRPRS